MGIEDLRRHQYRGGAQPTVLIKVTYSLLAELFGVKKRTLLEWVYTKKLDPRNLKDVAEKYCNKALLDKRRKG